MGIFDQPANDPGPVTGKDSDQMNQAGGTLSGLLGFVPGLGPVATAAGGLLGLTTGANSVNQGSQADQGINAAGTTAGVMGTIASLAGVAPELGTGLGAIGTGGAAGSAAAGGALAGGAAAAGVIGAGAAGWGYGNLLNSKVAESGILGKGEDGKDRSISDCAGDDGWAAHNAVSGWLGGGELGDDVGTVAGIGTTIGESVVGGLAGIAAAPFVLGETLGEGIGGLFK